MRKMAMVIIFVLLFRSIIFADFIDNGDGTVTDTITGLMWQKDTAPGRYSWGEALDYANNLTLAGYSDWRLPNINDLQTLVDYTNTAPAVYPTFIPHTESLRYWSSTPSASNTRMAWVLNTYYGSVHDYGKGWNCYLRAVRAGYKLSENIKVTAPAAGAQWQRGTTQTIQWTSIGTVGNVKIQLKDGIGNYSTIASSVSNSGSYNWTIPSNGDIGSGFQIRVSDVNHENTIYDFSDSFSLIGGTLSTPSSITVPTSSNTGNYTVTWEDSSISDVTYVLEEATDTAFTSGLRQAYVGTDTSAAITGRTSGNTYYYRVKATKSGYADSAWRTGSNGCTVNIQVGSLKIIIEPQEARDAGAQWRRTGTMTWRNSGYTETNIPLGSHTVEFKSINGWKKPDNQNITVIQGQVVSTGKYEKPRVVKTQNIAPIISLLLSEEKKTRLITTKWSQGGYYRYFYSTGDSPCTVMPKSEEDNYGNPYLVGCSTIAVSQLINYYLSKGYRTGWLEVVLQNIRVYPRFGFSGNFIYKDCIHPGLITQNSYPNTIDDWINNGASTLREFIWTVALGLDVHFTTDQTSFNADFGFLSGYQSIEEKMRNLLIDRFRFSPSIVFTTKTLTNLESAKNYIIRSIDSKQPVLASIRCDEAGHFVLIDNYRITHEGDFQVMINWGWGNSMNCDDIWYSGSGAITDPVKNYQWDKFRLFFNTVPVNYYQEE